MSKRETSKNKIYLDSQMSRVSQIARDEFVSFLKIHTTQTLKSSMKIKYYGGLLMFCLKDIKGIYHMILFFSSAHKRLKVNMHAKLLQSCPTLCNPMDCSLPASSVHEILQARILEWGCPFLLQGIFLTQESNLHFLHLMHWQEGSSP